MYSSQTQAGEKRSQGEIFEEFSKVKGYFEEYFF